MKGFGAVPPTTALPWQLAAGRDPFRPARGDASAGFPNPGHRRSGDRRRTASAPRPAPEHRPRARRKRRTGDIRKTSMHRGARASTREHAPASRASAPRVVRQGTATWRRARNARVSGSISRPTDRDSLDQLDWMDVWPANPARVRTRSPGLSRAAHQTAASIPSREPSRFFGSLRWIAARVSTGRESRCVLRVT